MITCDNITAPDNAELGACSSSIKAGSSCSMKCKTGYKTQGGANSFTHIKAQCTDVGDLRTQTCISILYQV